MWAHHQVPNRHQRMSTEMKTEGVPETKIEKAMVIVKDLMVMTHVEKPVATFHGVESQ